MKTIRLIAILLVIASSVTVNAQTSRSGKFSGKWYGDLIISPKQRLKVAFEIWTMSNGDYDAVMHSVDQKTYNILVDSISCSSDSIVMIVKTLGATFSGVLTNDTSLNGNFEQAKGRQKPFSLVKTAEFPFPIARRPQEPKKPYAYYTENVSFVNSRAGVTLRGTFTRPVGKGKYPAVILISGSGPSDRNQTIFGHKTFMVLADYLTRHGMAVLRYDDRGAGESTGNFMTATTVDHASDASAALDYLALRPDVEAGSMGVIGHSLGSDIAPIVAGMNQKAGFMVLLAGAAISLRDNIIEQCETAFPTMGITPEGIALNRRILESTMQIFRDSENDSIAKIRVMENLQKFDTLVAGMNPADREKLELSTPLKYKDYAKLLYPFMRYDLFRNPADDLAKVNCPVLALSGDKDLQVLPHNLDLIRKAVLSGGNTHITTKLYPGKNHLLQSCSRCTLDEYGEIEETMSPEVLQDIVDWILMTI